MRRGRPVRFLAVVLAGWIGLRIGVLWPGGLSAPVLPTAAARPTRSTPSSLVAVPAGADQATAGLRLLVNDARPDRRRSEQSALTLTDRSAVDPTVEAPSVSAAGPPPPTDDDAQPVMLRLSGEQDVTATTIVPNSRRSRLHGDAWFVARPNGGDNLAFGQLGASQAGVRITYALDNARRVALSGRLSAPLSGRGREAAAGVELRPTNLPVQLLIEARVPLDGGRALPAAQLIGGGAARLPLDLQLEGYGQAGVVATRGGFADGAARLSRAVLAVGRARVDLGAGAWGAAQRRVSRVDVGPTAALSLPAGPAAVRLGLDYRLRVAGRARPGSGPAVTLGGSF